MSDNLEYSIPPHGLNKQQKEKANEALKRLRFERLQQVNQEQKIYAELISLTYTLIDYLESDVFSEEFLFSEILKNYTSILDCSRRKLADDLGVRETKFSRLINNKENPSN